MDNLALLIGIGIPIIVMLGMYLFGLYTRRNIFWVFFALLWGALVYGGLILLTPKVLGPVFDEQTFRLAFVPLFQQGLIALGVLLVIWREKFDNLVDGAVYGIVAGLGYATFENFTVLLSTLTPETLLLTLVKGSAVSLVYVTAAGIVGIAITQFYFRHLENRAIFLLSGLGAAVGFIALYEALAFYQIGGDFLSPAFGIGGMTVVGLYIIGLLRKILIQVGVEKRRADSLLDIVIPIGIELSTEEKFGNLLETMLVQAKQFCHADGGMLYLLKDKELHYAVVRNDTLGIAMGGTSGTDVSYPPLRLYHPETDEPIHNNIITYAALTGETVNIIDAYENKKFDFTDTKAFDASMNYLTNSYLVIPLKDTEGAILGVLELFNAYDPRQNIFVPFDRNLQQLMESFSALASAALQGYIKEQSLRQEIKELRIEIDAAKLNKQVAEITDTDYFKELKQKSKDIREQKEDKE